MFHFLLVQNAFHAFPYLSAALMPLLDHNLTCCTLPRKERQSASLAYTDARILVRQAAGLGMVIARLLPS